METTSLPIYRELGIILSTRLDPDLQSVARGPLKTLEKFFGAELGQAVFAEKVRLDLLPTDEHSSEVNALVSLVYGG